MKYNNCVNSNVGVVSRKELAIVQAFSVYGFPKPKDHKIKNVFKCVLRRFCNKRVVLYPRHYFTEWLY